MTADEAVRFVLDGLGVDTIADARRLVELGQRVDASFGEVAAGELEQAAEVWLQRQRVPLP